jgi:hypothetical protein
MDSPYNSESELCGGAVAVAVSFSKYLPWQAFLTTLHPLLENVKQTVDHFEISYIGAPFPWLKKVQKSDWARSELNSVFSLEKVDG